DALKVVSNEAKKLGAKVVSGPSWTMEKLLLDGAGEATGIVSEVGKESVADGLVMCIGVWSDSLLDTKSQLQARCWILAHT
ncbi:hypothetical protein EJ08DRAFT_598582, partial [Tothia fuscella]